MLIIVLFLLAAAQAFAGQDTWTGVARVVAVGDVHGDYKAFTDILHSAGIIDNKGRWSGGTTHLVQTGDEQRGDDDEWCAHACDHDPLLWLERIIIAERARRFKPAS